jgi:hypothetical protein
MSLYYTLRATQQSSRGIGILGTATWLVQKFLKTAKQFFYHAIDLDIWVSDLKVVEDYGALMCDGFHCKHLDESDLPEIGLGLGEETRQRLHRELNNGHMCVLIFKGNIPIGYSLGASSLKKNEGLPPFVFDVHPKEDFIYFYGDYILSDCRRKGINSILTQYRFSEAVKEGFKKGFGMVDKNNVIQQRVLLKQGWTKDGMISFRRYLWFTSADMSNLKKYVR